MNHVKFIPWSRTTKTNDESKKEPANGRRISYVNDIRFRNLITAIIHRAIYLSKWAFLLLITWNKKRYRNTPQTVRVTKHLFWSKTGKKFNFRYTPNLKDQETNHEKTNKIFDLSYNLKCSSSLSMVFSRKKSEITKNIN